MAESLRAADSKVQRAIDRERERQESTLGMIASENHVSEAVLEAQGSALTNKYAEGYPGRRYYGGCDHVDAIERLAVERAKDLWGAEHVNVQPHSGTQANMGVYFAVLDPGDKILSLDLTHGGHLSHGHDVNFSGQLYEIEQYEVDPETGYVDYDDLAARARQFNPDLIVSGSSAYPREFDFARIGEIAAEVGAFHLADIAHVTGLVAAGIHANPVGVADFVTGSTHKTIRAGRGGIVMTSEEHSEAVDKAVFPGAQGGPLVHNIAGKAVGFGEALEPAFAEYAEQVVANAKTLADVLLDHGFGVVSGGTDKHLVLVDLRESHPDLTGSEAEEALDDVGIVLNANTVPGETRSPFNPSGIRIGTPALTTRGFGEEQMRTVGELVVDVLDDPEDGEARRRAAAEVDRLCEAFPVYDD
ncbi:serine hydroxymethyltransferase [Haloprofundus halobius]|uniref:serine hydroxymethyltransferase n=1 Tax=Haloprofundus halobius TaxID=2876194 RepID=UPI001CCDC7FC|nr:serine hydroxymethyltransferase [Haloprofundus halobius]